VFPSDPKKVIDEDGNKPGESGYKDTFDKKAEEKLDQLAKDLSIAIRDFVVAQPFSVTDLEATIQIPPITSVVTGASSAGPVTGTAVSPLIIADAVVKETGVPSNQSPQASLKSKISKVFLKKENVVELG
jgi:hypothetical protein